MQGLEYILKEMKEIKDRNREEKLYAKYPPHSEDQRALNAYSRGYEDGTDNFYNAIMYIIRKHMSGKGSNVHTNDGWIPVEERLPEGKALACDKYGEIAIGYIGGSADGCYECEDDTYIMFNVIAWRPLPEPYRPEQPTQRPEWKDRMLHTFLGGHHD